MTQKILAVKDINKKLESKTYIFGERKDLETDESWRQLIPYVVLTHKGKVAVFQRTGHGQEDRLHGKKMVGVGGHIDSIDALWCQQKVKQFVMNCMKREIFEEIKFMNECQFSEPVFNGLIVTDATPVDRVHIGALFTIEVNETLNIIPKFRSNDLEIKFRGWEYPTRIDHKEFETWSKIAIDVLLGESSQLKERWNVRTRN